MLGMIGIGNKMKYVKIPKELINYNDKEFTYMVRFKYLPQNSYYAFVVGKNYNGLTNVGEWSFAIRRPGRPVVYFTTEKNYYSQLISYNVGYGEEYVAVFRFNGNEERAELFMNSKRILLMNNIGTYIKNKGMNDLYIGCDDGDPDYNFSGMVKEFKMWNRALTDDEIIRVSSGLSIDKDLLLDIDLSPGYPFDRKTGRIVGFDYMNTRYVSHALNGLYLNGYVGGIEYEDIFENLEDFTILVEFVNHWRDYKGLVGKWISSSKSNSQFLITMYPYYPTIYIMHKDPSDVLTPVREMGDDVELGNSFRGVFSTSFEDGVLTLKNKLLSRQESSSQYDSKGINQLSKPVRIGNYQADGLIHPSTFKGILRRVIIWDRELSDDEKERALRLDFPKDYVYYMDYTTNTFEDRMGKGIVNILRPHLVG